MSASPTTVDNYAPRRSRAVENDTTSDGDVWQERLAVCEGLYNDGTPRLTIRSFYRNTRTSQRVWDEPPSGAAEIKFATAGMRQHAQDNLLEMQATLDMIPEEASSSSNNNKTKEADETKKRGFFGRLKNKKKSPTTIKDEAKDLNLQRAIARSMMDQKHIYSQSSDPVVYYNSETATPNLQPLDDEIEMAKALSLSENNTYNRKKLPLNYECNDYSNLSEDEILQRVLQESKLECQRV